MFISIGNCCLEKRPFPTATLASVLVGELTI
jgi:hypothetical protein